MSEVKTIDIKDIVANKYQPRQAFDSDALFKLSASIKQQGLLQPILVRKTEQGYEIIAGERRFRASMLAGKKSIQALVIPFDDLESAQAAIVENIQRENLTAIEEAHAFQRLIKEFGYSQTQVAAQMNKTQSSIANKLRLLKLPEFVQDGIRQQRISERHGRALLALDDKDIVKAYKKILEGGLTVAKTEAMIQQMAKPAAPSTKKSIRMVKSAQVILAENTLNQAIDVIKKSKIKIVVQKEETETECIYKIVIKK